MTQAVTIPVSAQGLASLADLARRNGTRDAFVDIAVQWALQAAQEIDRLQAEVEALRTRLEVDPRHPYDGIYCRDVDIRLLEKEVEALRAALAAKSLMQEQPK